MLRYSPAGVPVMQCLLEHRSSQLEAEVSRQVQFEIKAVALGTMAAELEAIDPGTELAVRGFLAPLRKGSRTLLLHITGLDGVEALSPSDTISP